MMRFKGGNINQHKPAQGDRGHQWRLDEDGEIDVWGLEYENHNGPRCELCDFAYCYHCGPPHQDCTGRK